MQPRARRTADAFPSQPSEVAHDREPKQSGRRLITRRTAIADETPTERYTIANTPIEVADLDSPFDIDPDEVATESFVRPAPVLLEAAHRKSERRHTVRLAALARPTTDEEAHAPRTLVNDVDETPTTPPPGRERTASRMRGVLRVPTADELGAYARRHDETERVSREPKPAPRAQHPGAEWIYASSIVMTAAVIAAAILLR